MNNKTRKEIHMIIGLTLVVITVIGLSFHTELELSLKQVFGEIEVMMTNELVRFAVIINFLYELVPQTFQVLGIGGIYVRALDSGVSPLVFVIGGTVGKLLGQLGLYYLGMHGTRKLFGKKGGMANANHWMHKYHYLIFLLPPFTGALGDLIMLYAGHKKISLVKVMPIIIVADVIDQLRWVYWTLLQLQTADVLS